MQIKWRFSLWEITTKKEREREGERGEDEERRERWRKREKGEKEERDMEREKERDMEREKEREMKREERDVEREKEEEIKRKREKKKRAIEWGRERERINTKKNNVLFTRPGQTRHFMKQDFYVHRKAISFHVVGEIDNHISHTAHQILVCSIQINLERKNITT